MKAKDLLWPIVLAASTVIVIISLFLNFYSVKSLGQTEGLGLFEDMTGAASSALHTIAMIAVILGLVVLVGMTVIALLKVFGIKVPKARLIAIIGAIIAAVAGVCVILFGLLFAGENCIEGILTISGGLGLFFAFAGLVIGAVSAFLTSKDLE